MCTHSVLTRISHHSPVSSLLVILSLMSVYYQVVGCVCVFQDEYKPNYLFRLGMTATVFAFPN